MTTIYISHRSALVAFLVAAAVKLYYRHRALRIVIVEVYDKRNASDTRPFCGVSTVSNLRMAHWQFLYSVLLQQVVLLAIFFAESVQVYQGSPPAGMSPEKSMWMQFLKVVARGGDMSRCLALFYWPQNIEQILFRFLSESANVSFMSVQNHHLIPAVIRTTSRHDLSPDVWLHFGSGDICNKRLDLDMLASARMATFENHGMGHGMSKSMAIGMGQYAANQNLHTEEHLIRHIPHVLQSLSVLWLPQFKGAADMFSEPIFNRQMHHGRDVVLVSIAPLNLDVSEEAFLARHDLLYGLKSCNTALEALDGLLRRHPLDVTPFKL